MPSGPFRKRELCIRFLGSLTYVKRCDWTLRMVLFQHYNGIVECLVNEVCYMFICGVSLETDTDLKRMHYNEGYENWPQKIPSP